MFFPIRAIKLIGVLVAGAAIVTGMLWSTLHRNSPTTASVSTQNKNIDVVRQQYADLYQAAWRQDEGRGNVTMTATLFVPILTDLLGQDIGKSEAENQLYRAVKDATNNEMRIFLTIDSVGGAQPDNAIRDSLQLSSDDQAFTLVSWQPLIFPSRIVNTTVSANSQNGVVTFVSGQPINWPAMTNVQLVSKNLGGIAARNFVWTQPGLLLEAQ